MAGEFRRADEGHDGSPVTPRCGAEKVVGMHAGPGRFVDQLGGDQSLVRNAGVCQSRVRTDSTATPLTLPARTANSKALSLPTFGVISTPPPLLRHDFQRILSPTHRVWGEIPRFCAVCGR